VKGEGLPDITSRNKQHGERYGLYPRKSADSIEEKPDGSLATAWEILKRLQALASQKQVEMAILEHGEAERRGD